MMTKKYLFLLLLCFTMGCHLSSSEKPVPPAAVPTTFNYSFSSPHEEFSINFYDQQGKLRVSIPLEQVKYVEWKEWMEYYLHEELHHQLDEIYLTGGKAEIVMNHAIVNRFDIVSANSSNWHFPGTVIFTGLEGHVFASPLAMSFFLPTKEKLYRYLKSKNKLME